MSTSKHIDVICVVVIILALLVTVLFMHGEQLGITPVKSEENDESFFTANDLNGAWDSSGATRIELQGDTATVSGGGAYVLDGDVHIVQAGRFVVRGTLTDGSILIDAGSGDKVWLLLDGADVSCASGAAIDVEQADKVFLTLAEGSENRVSSGAEFTQEAVDNGVDSAIFSRDDLTINGSGSLTVEGTYKYGIDCNDDLVVAGGTISVTAKEDAIHANDSGRFTNMTMTLSAGDDGVTVSNDEGTGYIYVQSGSITVTECYEGLEAVSITVAGGDIDVTCSDDGLNANGGSESIVRVTGGSIRVQNAVGRDADGFDSNGDIAIEGGTVLISLVGNGSNCALDCGSESGGVCTVSGGTVIACGGSSMAEGFDSSSTQCSFLHTLSSTVEGGSTLELLDADGTTLLRETIPNAYTCVTISMPDLALSETYTLQCGDLREEITLTDIATSNASGGMFGGMGGFGQQKRSGTQTQSGNESKTLLSDDFMPFLRGNVEGESEQNGQNRFSFSPSDGERPSRPDGERPSMPDGEMPSMPDGEMPSMPDGEMPSMPDGEMPSMPDGEMPSVPDGEMPSVPDGASPPDIQRDGAEESTAEAEETVNAAKDPQTWIWVGVSALVLLAGLAIVVLFKGKSVFAG